MLRNKNSRIRNSTFRYYSSFRTNTYFNLYLDKNNNKLKAYVSYLNDKKETEFSIHTIDYPPSDISRFTQPQESLKTNYYIEISVFLLLLLAGFLIKNRLKNKPRTEVETKEKRINHKTKKQIRKTEFQILFFGGFQIFDASNKDITGQFSPLLKELFLLHIDSNTEMSDRSWVTFERNARLCSVS